MDILQKESHVLMPGDRDLVLTGWRDVPEEAWREYVRAWEMAGETPMPEPVWKEGMDFAAMKEVWNLEETDAALKESAPTFLWFFMDVSGSIAGAVSFHPVLNHKLVQRGGNYRFGIRPELRRQGLGLCMVRSALLKARKPDQPRQSRFPKPDRVLLTCDSDDTASRRIIETCGGKFDEEIVAEGIPTCKYWIILHQRKH